MIYQVQTIPAKTAPLPKIDQDLIKARRIQARLNGRTPESISSREGVSWTPITSGPYVVPVTRWVE